MGVGGWLEQLGIKLISTQVVVEVEVGVELGKNKIFRMYSNFTKRIERGLTCVYLFWNCFILVKKVQKNYFCI